MSGRQPKESKGYYLSNLNDSPREKKTQRGSGDVNEALLFLKGRKGGRAREDRAVGLRENGGGRGAKEMSQFYELLVFRSKGGRRVERSHGLIRVNSKQGRV